MKKKLLPIIIVGLLISTGVILYFNSRTVAPSVVAERFMGYIKQQENKAAYDDLSKELQESYGSQEDFATNFVNVLKSENELDGCSPLDQNDTSLFVFKCDRKSSNNDDVVIIKVGKDGNKNKIVQLSRDGFKSFTKDAE